MGVHAVAVAEVVAVVVEVDLNSSPKDRFGLGWRPQLAAGILANLYRIDIVEVIADDFFRASRRNLRALRTLAAQTEVTLHGVSLGLASSVAVDDKRLMRWPDFCDEIRPVSGQNI